MATSREHIREVPVAEDREPREQVVDRTSRASWSVGPGMVLGALGAIGVIVSMFLPWRTGSVHASDVPVAFLWDHNTTAHDPSILIALIPLAALLVIGAVMPSGAVLRAIGGVGTLAVAALFPYQLHRVLNTLPGGKLGDVLDSGFYFAAIGGVIGFISAFVASVGLGRRVDREVVTDGPAYR